MPDQDTRVWRWALRVSWFLLLAMLLYVAWSSRLLRPGADDYCLAVDAGRGILGGLGYWFEEVSGYVTFGFGAMVFVGWPLRHLPLPVASAIPFLVAILSVGLTGVTSYWSTLDSRTWISFVRAFAWVPAIGIAWLAFLWLPVATGSDGISRWMAHGLAHWQTLNGSYVLLTSVWLLSAIVLWILTARNSNWFWAFLPLGIALGFGGAANAIAAASICAVVLGYNWFARTILLPQHRKGVGVMLAGVIIGGVASHLAPGTQSRSNVLGATAPTSFREVAELLNGTLPEAITVWVQSLAHVGAILLVTLVLTIGWLLAKTRADIDPRRGAALAAALFGFGLVWSLASRFSQQFAYDGYWHFMPTWLFSFLALLVGSLSLGAYLARSAWAWETPAVLSIGAAAMLVVAGAMLELTTSMATRALAWETGPATLPGMVSDLENPVGMEIACWRELGTMRDLPSRGSY